MNLIISHGISLPKDICKCSKLLLAVIYQTVHILTNSDKKKVSTCTYRCFDIIITVRFLKIKKLGIMEIIASINTLLLQLFILLLIYKKKHVNSLLSI